MEQCCFFLQKKKDALLDWYDSLTTKQKYLVWAGVVVIGSVAIQSVHTRYQNYRLKLPPCHRYTVPVIGSLIMTIFYLEHQLLHEFPKYGDIMYYYLAGRPTFCIQDAVLATKVFDKALYRNRLIPLQHKPDFKIWNGLLPFENDLSLWTLRRKLFQRSLNQILDTNKYI